MILLTGAVGFVGMNLYDALDQPHNIAMVDPRMSDSESLEGALKEDIEVVFHLGAISDTTCEDYSALSATNVALPCRLAEFCHGKNIPFIYASSASVYGNGDGPLNAYAHSKAAFDNEISSQPPRCPWYGLRFFNCYGPGEEHKGAQASMVHQFLNGRKEMFCPDARRDFIHVDDVVSVMIWMWRNLPPSGIYDVGTGRSRSFRELANLTQPLCGVVGMPKSLEGKYQFNTCADLAKLRDAGYSKGFLSLEEGLMLCA